MKSTLVHPARSTGAQFVDGRDTLLRSEILEHGEAMEAREPWCLVWLRGRQSWVLYGGVYG